MNTIDTYLNGRVLGLGNAHIEDTTLHTHLLGRANQLGLPMHEIVHANRSPRCLGELPLALAMARWVEAKGIDVLATPATADHVEHYAAAHIGRLAVVALRARGYQLDLLELQPHCHPHKDSIWVEGTAESKATAERALEPKPPETVLWSSAFPDMPPLPWPDYTLSHQPHADGERYRLLLANQVAIAPNIQARIMDQQQYAILNG